MSRPKADMVAMVPSGYLEWLERHSVETEARRLFEAYRAARGIKDAFASLDDNKRAGWLAAGRASLEGRRDWAKAYEAQAKGGAK